jgi:hypothetical protein
MRIPLPEEAVPAAVNSAPGGSRREMRSPVLSRTWLPPSILLSLALMSVSAMAQAPRLAVVIVVDQMRADYLERFRPFYGEGGFARLLHGGAVYANCQHRHALTATAPGHATLLTGVHADRHGIIDNDWIDRTTWTRGDSVADTNSPLVGGTVGPPGPGGVWAARAGASPHRLLASTVGDQLKLRFGDQSRVIALGSKDRSPILMGGRLADGAYWLHEGRFVTSRFYRDVLPEWVEAFNSERRVDTVFGTTWDRMLDASAYNRVQGPDDAAGEESRLGLGVTFPRRIDGGEPVLGPKFYEAFRLTPAANDVLVALAERAIAAERLGHHAAPDLLCIGFSQPDHAGHSFGPDSHEIMDSFVRLDRALARLFATLDRDVGPEHYVVVLSADHGVAPLPERMQALDRGGTAGRLDVAALDRAVQSRLDETFGPAPDATVWALRDGFGFHLMPATLAARNVSARDAAIVLKAVLSESPQIAVAWTRDELLGNNAPEGARHVAAWRLSHHAERSPDVVFSPPPFVVDRKPAGTNHRTPYAYDTAVPLVWYGVGVTPGHHVRRVTTDALAPTLAGLLGLPSPPEAHGERLF